MKFRFTNARPARRSGFTLVELLVVMAIIGVLIGMLLPALGMVRELARRTRCSNRLRQLGLAVQSFEMKKGRLPASWRPVPPYDSAVANNGWSAQAQLLPHFQEGQLYDTIDFDKPYSDPANVVTLADGSTMPIGGVRVTMFLCPSEAKDEPRFSGGGVRENYPINYVVNLGTWFVWDSVTGTTGGGAFLPNQQMRSESFGDGASKTLCFSEVKGWTPYMRDANLDSPVEPTTPAEVVALGFGQFKTNSGHTEWVDGRAHQIGFTTTFTPNTRIAYTSGGEEYDIDWTNHREGKVPGKPTYAVVTARSYHPGSVNVSMIDGSVHSVSDDIKLSVWRALSTRDGNDSGPAGQFFLGK
jgi:prepilin-type N-terminal cleavage/methylation domain-containing protein/prepilin-type processing-associated H-X9-DG protein